MGNNQCATSHMPTSCMVKLRILMENCPSMDKRSSPRLVRAFQIRFGVDKHVKALDLSCAMASLKQYGGLSSIRSSSNSLIHFSVECLATRSRAGPPCIAIGDPLCRHFAYHKVIKARAHCAQLPRKKALSFKVMCNGKWRDVPCMYDELVPCSQRAIYLMVHRPAN